MMHNNTLIKKTCTRLRKNNSQYDRVLMCTVQISERHTNTLMQKTCTALKSSEKPVRQSLNFSKYPTRIIEYFNVRKCIRLKQTKSQYDRNKKSLKLIVKNKV